MQSKIIEHISMVVTTRCNLSCKHCYVAKKVFEYEPDNKILFNRIAATPPDTLYVSGGEPFLMEGIGEYAAFCQEHGIRLSICTNGTVRDDLIAELLNHKTVENIVVGVELPFDVYKRIRGNGYADIVRDNIKSWTSISPKVVIDCTIVTYNSQLLKRIVEEAWNLGVRRISLKRFRPVGRGRKYKNLLEVEPYVYFDALLKWGQMAAQLRNEMTLTSEDPIFKPISTALLNIPIADLGGDPRGCLAGTAWIGIMPNGDVYPCPLMLHSGYPVTSIYDKPLREIAASTVVREFCDASRIEGCRDCRFEGICRGCRVHAWAKTGSFWARDPYCPLEWIGLQTNS